MNDQRTIAPAKKGSAREAIEAFQTVVLGRDGVPGAMLRPLTNPVGDALTGTMAEMTAALDRTATRHSATPQHRRSP